MDFVASTDPQDLVLMLYALDLVGIDPGTICLSEAGPWGSFAATSSPYRGLQPLSTEDEIVAVVGDPLLDLPSNAGQVTTPQRARTAAIAHLWADSGAGRAELRPEHPAALIRIARSSREIEVLTDVLGAVPVYYSEQGSRLLISTSPDVIAAMIHPELDELSAVELLVAGRLSFPHTLYRGVEQLLPGSRHRWPQRQSSRWWTPPTPEASGSVDHWSKLVEEALEALLSRVAEQVADYGVVTLSAGQDTRAVAIVASRHMTLEAVTLTAVPNPESWIAARVARRLGIPHRLALRSRNHYGDVYRTNPVVLTTQNLWDHAHFHLGALGLDASTPSVIGGYMADTVFREQSTHRSLHGRLIRAGEVSPGDHPWAVSDLVPRLSASLRSAIDDRWVRARELLQLTKASADLALSHPLSSTVGAAHFHAARRNGPQYEPFMTRRCVDLAFRIPPEVKANFRMNGMFPSARAATRWIPINPTNIRGINRSLRTWRRLPDPLVPSWVNHPESWSTLENPRSDPSLEVQFIDAVNQMGAIVGLQLPLDSMLVAVPSLQVLHARMLTAGTNS